MKKFTKVSPPLNQATHNRAFEHALALLKDKVTYPPHGAKTHHRGTIIRFFVSLDLEDETSIRMEFSRVTGFRINIDDSEIIHAGAYLWNDGVKNVVLSRRLHHRLQFYRDLVCRWNRLIHTPLTFRHFNLLLASLSYDLEYARPHRD